MECTIKVSCFCKNPLFYKKRTLFGDAIGKKTHLLCLADGLKSAIKSVYIGAKFRYCTLKSKPNGAAWKY